MSGTIATAAPKDWQTISYSRKIAELLRIMLGRHTHPVDDVALRELLLTTDEREALVEFPKGAFTPVVTPEGARVCQEIIATWENQT